MLFGIVRFPISRIGRKRDSLAHVSFLRNREDCRYNFGCLRGGGVGNIEQEISEVNPNSEMQEKGNVIGAIVSHVGDLIIPVGCKFIEFPTLRAKEYSEVKYSRETNRHIWGWTLP